MRSQEWGITEQHGRLLFDFILRKKPRLAAESEIRRVIYRPPSSIWAGGRVLSIDRNPDLPDWARTARIDPDSASDASV